MCVFIPSLRLSGSSSWEAIFMAVANTQDSKPSHSRALVATCRLTSHWLEQVTWWNIKSTDRKRYSLVIGTPYGVNERER